MKKKKKKITAKSHEPFSEKSSVIDMPLVVIRNISVKNFLALDKCIFFLPVEKICFHRNLEVDGCPSKEKLFGQSALLMNPTYIVFP